MLTRYKRMNGDGIGRMPEQDRPASGSSLFGSDNPYVRFLLDNRNRAFYLKPYKGNSGDLLIWLGTERLFEDFAIPRTVDPRKADIILIPGGNQTMWQTNVNVWKDVWLRYPNKDFAVGPTTVQLGVTSWQDDIKRYNARITAIFARDPDSHANLQTCGLEESIRIGLSHDPALYLRDSRWIRDHREAATNEFVLATFRDDLEGARKPGGRLRKWVRPFVPRGLRRMDGYWRGASRRKKLLQVALHTRSRLPLKQCDVSKYPLEYCVEIVRSAAEVHTDRLHVMLLAVMLGKPTVAYSTAYGKLESVYEHSVKDWAHVEFAAGTQVSPPRERT